MLEITTRSHIHSLPLETGGRNSRAVFGAPSSTTVCLEHRRFVVVRLEAPSLGERDHCGSWWNERARGARVYLVALAGPIRACENILLSDRERLEGFQDVLLVLLSHHSRRTTPPVHPYRDTPISRPIHSMQNQTPQCSPDRFVFQSVLNRCFDRPHKDEGERE